MSACDHVRLMRISDSSDRKTSKRLGTFTLVAALGGLALTACGSSGETPAPVTEPTPPPPPIEPLPEQATFDMEKAILGRRLYHDTRLSGDGTLSCASCHDVASGGAEPRRVSTGIHGQQGPINSPTVLNSGLNFAQFWDGRAATLEEQAAGPVANPMEMGANWETVVATLQASAQDVQEFTAVYPDGITQANVTNAIAEYERSLQTPARFDAFLRGNTSELSAQEQRGWATFTEVGCTTCHRGQNIGGGMYQRMGLVQNYFEQRGTPLTDADQGHFNVSHDEADRHRFKVPTLRNVALTAPYFHDGSQEDLASAVRVMGRVQLNRELTDAQITDIVAFLGSLTGTLPAHALMPAAIPVLPPNPTTPVAPEAVLPAAATPVAIPTPTITPTPAVAPTPATPAQ